MRRMKFYADNRTLVQVTEVRRVRDHVNGGCSQFVWAEEGVDVEHAEDCIGWPAISCS